MWLMQLIDDGLIVYGVGQLEQSASGLMHWQFYVVTKPNPKNKNGCSLTWMKENVHKTAHWEKRMGTHEQARDYCRKDETRSAGPYEFGEWDEHATQLAGASKGGQVHRSKLQAIKAAIDADAEDAELYETNFTEMLRYSKSFDKYRLTKTDTFRKQQTKGLWVWGPAHTGKSTWARQFASKIEKDPYYLNVGTGGNIWFDGMKVGCKVVVIEDFHGNVPINFMLKLLDHTPLQVELKGSTMPFVADWLVIVSNKHFKDCYGQGETTNIPDSILQAFWSRFTGARGAVRHMTQVMPAEEGVDVAVLVDEIDTHEPQLDDLVVDLTASDEPLTPSETVAEDQPEGGRDTYGEDDDGDAGSNGYDGRFGTDEEAIAWAEQQAAEDLEEIALREGRLQSKSGPSRLKRTLSFHKETPVQGQFKKLGSQPSQTYLRRHGVDDDEDVDDK